MLEKTSLENLENSEYRLKVFEKYKDLKKPDWKRVKYKYEEPQEFKKFDNFSTKNENQEGMEVKGINDSLEDLERLKSNYEYGLGEFFKLQNFAFYNQGQFIKIKEKKN